MTWDWGIVSDILQIAILYQVIHMVLKRAWGSRFGQALMGVGVLAVAMVAFTYFLHFDVLSRIVQGLLIYLAISAVVIFQPEIRRGLSMMGAFSYLERPKYMPDGSATVEFTVRTIMALAERRMGALFAFERGISLKSYEATGVTTNATFSRELVTCIFTPPLPLHDGGMIIRDGRIAAAHCVFPVSNNPDLINRGMRHRAAVGLSEETDAIVVVVSEETGSISVARNGKLFRYEGADAEQPLLHWITMALPGGRQADTLIAKLYARLSKGFRT